ncbi:MFS transporter [Plantactinospora sp. GCM10030261]|uniref:MFS transporter n=1 Tax=Plantactinospora sp. GCM10030261 TaxID=3273420 RepID=UPI0036169911
MHEVIPTHPVVRAGRREWLGLAALALPTLLVALDIGALFLALPHLSADLGVTSSQQLWISDAYGFLLAGFLVTMGTLGDRIGRRRLLLIGAVAFTAASVLAAYAPGAGWLIVARALLGVAGASISPSTLALISNMFRDSRQRARAISLWAACQFGGAALGPVVGGLLLEHFWWGSVFLLAVPVMVVLLVVGPMLLPEYRNPDAGRLDLLSVLLSLGAILPVVYGVKEFAVGGGTGPVRPAAAIAVGLAVGVVFVRRQLRLTNPLLDLGLVRLPAIRVVLPAMLVASGTLAGLGLLSTQWVQSVGALSPGAAGLWQAPTGLGIAAGTLLAPLALRRLTPARTMLTGLGCAVVGLVAVTTVGNTGSVPLVAAGVAVVALGVGPLFVLGTGMVVGSAPPERAGSAASVSETVNVFGSTLGMALLGSVGAAVYRSGMAGTPWPTGDPLAGPDTDAARETIAAATVLAGRLPAEQAAELLDAARTAFTSALIVTAGIGATIVVLLTVALGLGLRRDQPSDPTPPAPAEPAQPGDPTPPAPAEPAQPGDPTPPAPAEPAQPGGRQAA